MTIGTLNFLKKYEEKYASINFYLMDSGTNSLIYYEDVGKSIFQAGRAFEIVLKSGDIKEEGFVVMNHIPVTDDGRPVFEDRFKRRQGAIDKMPGFQAFRLLRPIKDNTYIVFTQWEKKSDYEIWKDSNDFKKSHEQPIRPPAYYADTPFITTYTMIDEEED